MILRPYQKAGVKFVETTLKKYNGAYIADETGLGKTLQALTIIQRLNLSSGKNILIIVPSFLREKWKNEIKKSLPGKKEYRILITTFSELINPQILKYFLQLKYEFLVIDEAHYLKELTSLRTQAIVKRQSNAPAIIQRAKKCLWLSATPFANGRVGEIYSFLFSIRHPVIKGKTQDEFIEQWAARAWYGMKNKLNHTGIKNADKFRRSIKDVLIRREKHKVIKDLPKGTRDLIPIEINAKMYKEESQLLKNILIDAGFKERRLEIFLENPEMLLKLLELLPSFPQYANFKKQQGLIKIKPVSEFIFNWLEEADEKEKIMVLAYHRDTAKQYRDLFKKHFKTRESELITGDTEGRERFAVLEKIKKIPGGCLFATMGAIKEGFDLNEFPTSFFTEPDWSPYLIEQCEGRNLRPGQRQPVFWYHFLYNKGLEKNIFKLLETKRKTIKELIG